MIRKMTALSLAGLVAFIACKKSDNPTTKPPVTPDSVSIIGKWSLFRDVAYYYNPSSGAFMDSAKTDVGSKDYYDFENGIVYFHEDDGSSAYPFTDTLTYKFHGAKNIIWNGADTISYQLTKNTKDTLLITNIIYNSQDGYGAPANEYDTVVMIK